jgi:hypothetical protein
MAFPDPPLAATELEMLTSFLDYYRAVIADKASGLTAQQLDTRLSPSSLTLGGIVHHLALVENWWFHDCFAGEEAGEPWDSAPFDDDPDWDFHVAATLEPDVILDRYRSQCERSRQVVAGAESLDQPTARAKRNGDHWTLRWILVHMIEETARHAGHADLIRESIDGETGDFREVT